MARYRKDDVEFHSDGFRERRPAVNVKTDPWNWERHIGAAREYEGDGLDPRFEDWYREAAERDGFLDGYWEFACEAGWETLQADAEFYFGAGVKVYSEGRSGGWAVVDGLPDFEDWDAIMLTKWHGFAESARIIADGIPGDMAILASINAFESWLATQPSAVQVACVKVGVGL